MVPLQLPNTAKKKNRPAPWVMGVAIAGVITVAGGGYVLRSRSAAQVSVDQYTQRVEEQNLTVRIEASGTLNPSQSVNVSPKVAGIVKQLLVEQGQRVTKGQVIARMDDRGLRGQSIQADAAWEQAKANLAQLKAGNLPEEINQARSNWLQAQAALKRIKADRRGEISELESRVTAAAQSASKAKDAVTRLAPLNSKGAIAKREFDDAVRDSNVAQANLDEAKSRLNRMQNRLDSDIAEAQATVNAQSNSYRLAQKGSRPEEIAQAAARVKEAQGRRDVIRTQLQDTVIRAPFSGIVTQKYASIGAFVTPTTSASATSSATSASIVAIARDIEVLAKVPEIDIGKINQGQQVEIKADSYPDQVFKGQVRLVAPEAIVEQNVTSFQVRVTLITGREVLRSGMNADLTFLGDQIDEALVVPTVAIATRKGQTGVYLPDAEDKPQFQPVTIGSTIGNKTQILDGLESGERVFIDFPEGVKPEEDADQPS